MPPRNVVLTDRHAGLIDQLVESGRYRDGDEVLREGLRLVEAREAEDAIKLEALRAAAKVGIDAMDRGDYEEFADVAAMKSYLRELTAGDVTASDEE